MTTENLSLVALSPADVPGQQVLLADWCKRKAHEAAIERSDFLDNARIAVEHGWQYQSLNAAARRAELRQQYYEKIGAAVDAGYLIVPNFDVEVMAVRVKRRTPQIAARTDSCEYSEPSEPRLPEVRPDLLPVGQGAYVDAQAKEEVQRWSTPHPTDTNKKKQHVMVKAVAFDAPDFPVLAVKPVVMDATARAMSLKIFDRMGVVTGRREDPVVLGQIIDPRGGQGGLWGRPRKVVSFFVAWWLDTKSL